MAAIGQAGRLHGGESLQFIFLPVYGGAWSACAGRSRGANLPGHSHSCSAPHGRSRTAAGWGCRRSDDLLAFHGFSLDRLVLVVDVLEVTFFASPLGEGWGEGVRSPRVSKGNCHRS